MKLRPSVTVNVNGCKSPIKEDFLVLLTMQEPA